jgi:beta-lactam-binding protein with PASTA domain
VLTRRELPADVAAAFDRTWSCRPGPNSQPATTVPDVIGQDQATAASNLRSAGFKVVVLNRPTTNQSKDGVVIDEQPRPGSSIPGGSQVTIFVGRFSG